MGSALFTKWSSAEDNGNCEGHYEERKRALCGTENVCHTRLYILIFSWDFRGCRTLPFSRGQTMPKFPKNICCPETKPLVLQGTNFLILRQPSKFHRSKHIAPHFIIVSSKKQGGIFQTFFEKMDGDDGIGKGIREALYFFPTFLFINI